MASRTASLDRDAILTRMDKKGFWESELGDRVVQRTGSNWTARSPFRLDRNPSFSVNVERGLYNDFAAGGGDTFHFLKRKYGMGFQEALEYIRDKYSGTNPWTGVNVNLLRAMTSDTTRTEYQHALYPAEEFRFAEVVRGHLGNRAKSPAVEIQSPWSIDEFQNPVLEPCYASVYRHVQLMATHKDNPNTGGGAGSIAGYNGPVKAEGVHFDFDNAENPNRCLEEVQALIKRLMKDCRVKCGCYHLLC